MLPMYGKQVNAPVIEIYSFPEFSKLISRRFP